MDWQPQDGPLRLLAGCLRDSLSAYNRVAQKQAEQMLSEANSSPDFVNYLTYLFSSQQPPSQIEFLTDPFFTVRIAAAINLKNKLKTAYKSIPPSSLAYVRASVSLTLLDPSAQIRSFAGNVITEIVQQGGLLDWPQLLSELLSLVGNDTGNVSSYAQEGAMLALSRICEDNRKLLDKDFQGQRPLNVIIPKLLDFTANSNPRIRSTALATIKAFIPQKPQALLDALNPFLARLFQLANDPSHEVQRNVCQSITMLVDVRPETLLPHMEGLVNYILIQQQNLDDTDLALDAAEFWLSVGEHDQLSESLGPYLQKVIPVLLQSMIYGAEDVDRLTGGADDADEEDKAEDLKPQFARQKVGRLAGTASGNGSSANLTNGTNGVSPINGLARMEDDDDLSEGEIEDDDEDGGDPEDRWNLRKCSAAALDVLATVFHQPVFEIILPYLKENLRHDQWPNREAAVLALGAIADGCMDVVTPHLPELIPYLISLLNDVEPVVRQITCWCLGRYSEWASHLENANDRRSYFEPMMEGILNRMLDNNKRVQEAAASAFASLEEKSEDRLTPYCEPILQQFVRCFAKYKDRNMYILYDCVQTLADHVSSELARPDLVHILMPALIERWQKVTDQSRELFPLLECLGYIAAAYGDAFSPFAPHLFARSIRIIYQNLQEQIVVDSGQAVDEPDKDFLVTSLDLLSAIIQAIDPQKSGELVSTCLPQFFDLLPYCMKDPNTDVRQSSYALLGDCAINIFSQLQPFLPAVMPVLIKQLDLDTIRDEDSENGFSVLNNACWSCGEIGMKAQDAMIPYIGDLYMALIAIMSNEEVPDSVDENAAMALGRLGIGCAQSLAPHLAEFAGPFLGSMSKIDHNTEKASAFLGFNRVVEKNPKAMEKCLVNYFQAIAVFPKIALAQSDCKDVQQSFQQVIQGYKDLIPDFNSFLSQLPLPVLQKLRGTYRL